VDADGEPVAAAVVIGGGNWTPSFADGTFWLDNVDPGPLTILATHHAWRAVRLDGVASGAQDVVVAFRDPLPRVTLTVVDATQAPVPLVTVDWAWPPGHGQGPFVPDSRFWHDLTGVFALTVPEGAVGATVSDGKGATAALAAEDLADGASRRLTLSVAAAPPR
jgi:hypothetical protein